MKQENGMKTPKMTPGNNMETPSSSEDPKKAERLAKIKEKQMELKRKRNNNDQSTTNNKENKPDTAANNVLCSESQEFWEQMSQVPDQTSNSNSNTPNSKRRNRKT